MSAIASAAPAARIEHSALYAATLVGPMILSRPSSDTPGVIVPGSLADTVLAMSLFVAFSSEGDAGSTSENASNKAGAV